MHVVTNRSTSTPRNHGTPWTSDQHELLVERVRAGDDIDAIAEAVGRTPGTVPARIKRLLPPDDRDHPGDLLLDVARKFLSDPSADWRDNLLKSTPPRPIITPPPIVRSGYGGIPDNDLVAIAYALIAAHGARAGRDHASVFAEVDERGKRGHLVGLRVTASRYEPGAQVPEYQLRVSAEEWVNAAIDPDRRSRSYSPWAPPAPNPWGDNLGR